MASITSETARIPVRMPSEQTVQETVALAYENLDSTTYKVATTVLSYFLMITLAVPAAVATLVKWVVVNPFLYLRDGEIKSKNPVELLVDYVSSFSKEVRERERAFKTYTEQLLHADVVTDAHIDAFCQLVKETDIDEVSLIRHSSFSNHYIREGEQAPYIDPPILARLIRQIQGIQRIKTIIIPPTLSVMQGPLGDRPENQLARRELEFVEYDLQRAGFVHSHSTMSYIRAMEQTE